MELQKAIFAGGCFWCTEAAFSNQEGVASVTSGYTGGSQINPTYEEVSKGITDHYEAVEVVYDPELISYETLLEIYWKSIDPTDQSGQFADRGKHYETVIFYQNNQQKEKAERSKEEISRKLQAKISTKIKQASDFYPAEDYHQDYHEKNPSHYQEYKYGSGRVKRLKDLWDKEK